MAINQEHESVTAPYRAIGFFTDRENETRHFLTYLNSEPTPEKVLFFWGEGGNGKSLFLEYLRKYFCKLPQSIDVWNEHSSLNNKELVSYFKSLEEEYHPVKQAFLDFEIYLENYRPKDSIYALMQLRRDLSGCKMSFPLFDFAAALYLHKTKRLDKHKDLFPKEIADLGTEIAVVILEHGSAFKIGKAFLNVINKYNSKSIFLSRKESKAAKIDEETVRKLHFMDPEKELVYTLPGLFASDLNESMKKDNTPKRVVLFFDTHEAFWGTRERHLADHHLFERDEWLRKFISSLDLDKGIIVVVAGRERPKWSTPKINYCIPEKNIDTQLIGHFTETDSRDYLKKNNITDVSLQNSLIELAKVEKDQIHPLFLGLCVDIILQAKINGIKLTDLDINQWLKEEASNKEQELINTFLKYVEDRELDFCIKAVSLCRSFDFEIYFELGKKLNLAVSEPAFQILINFSFVRELEIAYNKYRGKKVYRIHDLLRRVMNEINNDFVIKAHKVIESYYREKVNDGDLTALGEAIYHKTQINWIEGVAEWCEKFDEALELSNFQLCNVLQNLSFDLKVDDGSILAISAYNRGKYFFAISRYDEAIKELKFSIQQYDRLLSQDSNYKGIYNNKGLALQSLGDLQASLSQHQQAMESYTKAIDEYDKALTLTPDYIDVYNNKSYALQRQGDLQASLSQHQQAKESYTKALDAYDKALSLAPDDIFVHNNKGLVLQSLGDLQASKSQHQQAKESYTKAVDAYDKALSLAPDFIKVHNNKGNSLQRLGDLQASKSQYQQAKESYSKAIDSYDKALTLAPDYIDAYNNKGHAQQRLGDLQASLSQHQQAKESYSKAIDAYDKALTLAPDYIIVYNNKGNVMQRLGDLQASLSQHQQAKASYFKAIDAYDNALALAPDYVSVYNNKGTTLANLGDLQASLSQHQQAKESYSKAIEAYDKALSLAPDYNNAYCNIGLVLQSLGELQVGLSQQLEAKESYSKAIDAYDKALMLAPNFINAYNSKGNALLRLGDLQVNLLLYQQAMESYTKAIDVYDKALALAPDDIFVHNNKGIALQSMGDLQSSLFQQQKAKESYALAIAEYDHVLRIVPNLTLAKRRKEEVILCLNLFGYIT